MLTKNVETTKMLCPRKYMIPQVWHRNIKWKDIIYVCCTGYINTNHIILQVY